MILGLFKAKKKMEPEYCCKAFGYRHQCPSSKGINIRIVKLSENDVLSPKELDNPYRYFVSSGELKEGTRIARIHYCPFCGDNLSNQYNEDSYVNESVNALTF